LLNKLLAFLALSGAALAGPVEFGRAELDKAIAARGLNPRLFQIKTEVAVDPPESYRIVPGLVTGGDLRGLMYGLLEAADQVRRTGRLQKVEALPGMALRGVRVTMDDLDAGHDRWPAVFRALAAARFNWFQVYTPDLAGTASEKNLEALRFISDSAADYGIDFVLGFDFRQPTDGPDLYAVLVKVLAVCPGIRGLRLTMDGDLAADAIRAIRETSRRVALALPLEDQVTARLGTGAGLSVWFSAAYPSPSRPAKGTQFFWTLPAPAAAGAPELERLVNKLDGNGAGGFEIDVPPSLLLQAAEGDPAWLALGRLAYDVTERK
jgi:hypothetical protein